MKTSKLIGAVFSIAIVGGVAIAIAKGGNPPPVNTVCSSVSLSMPDQNACKAELSAAQTDETRQLVTSRFQYKIDAQANGLGSTRTPNNAS